MQKSAHVTHFGTLGTGHELWGGGRATKWQGGGQVKFYPYKRRGEQKKVLAVLKGGGGATTRFEEVLTWELEVLALVIGGGGGAQKVLPCL